MDVISHRSSQGRKRRTGIRSWMLLLAVCSGLANACVQSSQSAKTDRPERYSPTWGQFILDTYTNPRQLSVFRLGAGKARPAEYWVFEWTDQGQRLRRLHRATLKSEWMPWTWRAEGDGRFLVTFDDRFSPQGTTDNCVVMYDFVRSKTVARRADDFVPKQWLESQSTRRKWSAGPAYVDPLLHRIYPSSLTKARKGTSPFVVVDLPSLTVRVEPPPERLPERVYRETADGHAWEWEFSMGKAKEPNWLSRFALPAFLKGKRVRPLQDMRPFGTTDGEVIFRLDESSGDYVRCPAEAWRDPPEIWTKVKKREQEKAK